MRALITLLIASALLAGTASDVVASSHPVMPAVVAGATRIEVTLTLHPRHPAVLQRLALASSAARPLPAAVVRALFLPLPGQVARVRSVMLARGLRFQSQRALALSFTGTAAAVDRAFGVTLQVSRRADGSFARRPSATPHPPAAIATLVQDIAGLDTRELLQPAVTGGSSAQPPPCAAAKATGGYLPSQLGSARGYGFSSLVGGGWDGSGESIAMVEFSNYKPSDIATYQSCFGTEVPVSTVAVGAGTADRSGSDEAELDIETAISAAPGLDGVRVYVAKPNGTMAAVVNAIVAEAPSTGVRIVSDSWGVCEPRLSPARAAATNAALQLAAVSGITFLAASGDSGSYDCTGFRVPAVDDPAAQLFATGVGGTDLRLAVTGAGREVVWNDGPFGAGGGGLSRFWSRPSWQAGPGVSNRYSTGARQVPDISLYASPAEHGYPVYCTTLVCAGAGWTTFGGTSAAAPLMAGIVADMNSYSRAHGGQRLGYANPFLYDRFAAHPAAFRDVTRGTNNPFPPGPYPATAGYDLASGIGAPRAAALAADLAGYVPVAPNPAVTGLTALPARDRVVRYGQPLVLHGRLSDAGGGIAAAPVVVQGGDLLGIREWRRHTDASGRWTLTLARQLVRKTRWRAVYLGTIMRQPAVSPRHTIYVIPPLSARVSTHAVPAGRRFRFSGTTLGVLQGRPVSAEYRRQGGHWRRFGPAGVGPNGGFGRDVSLGRPGRYELRWHYHGSRNGQWLTGYSTRRSVAVL